MPINGNQIWFIPGSLSDVCYQAQGLSPTPFQDIATMISKSKLGYNYILNLIYIYFTERARNATRHLIIKSINIHLALCQGNISKKMYMTH